MIAKLVTDPGAAAALRHLTATMLDTAAALGAAPGSYTSPDASSSPDFDATGSTTGRTQYTALFDASL